MRSSSSRVIRLRARRALGATLRILVVSTLGARLLGAQGRDLDALAVRLAGMTAVTGLEQAMADSLVALLPGSVHDRAGNVTLVIGQGAPRRLVSCPLDEVGYVVGHITADGYLLLRRVGQRVAHPLFDQELEGNRVTVFGRRGPVPGVVAVHSVHLTRGRAGPGAPDPVFTVDNAYVDVGVTSAAEAEALGVAVLAPVSLAKRPTTYGDRLLAAPAAGRRASCAALARAVLAGPKVHGTVVVAFTAQGLASSTPGLASVRALAGPFDEEKTVTLPTRYPDTAIETVALSDAEALVHQLVAWMEGR